MYVKFDLFVRTIAGTILLIGISGTLARYLRKLLHRFVAESPKLYQTSFWLQIAGVIYICYIFNQYWSMGLLTGHWFLKLNLLLVNTFMHIGLKVVMIEASQNQILRDLAIINFVFISYVVTYAFAGYPWWTFGLYLAVIADRIFHNYFMNQLSP